MWLPVFTYMEKQKNNVNFFFTNLTMVNVKEFSLIPLSCFTEGTDIDEFFSYCFGCQHISQ